MKTYYLSTRAVCRIGFKKPTLLGFLKNIKTSEVQFRFFRFLFLLLIY